MMGTFYRHSWGQVAEGIQQEKVGMILEVFLRNRDFIPSCIGASVAFTVGLLILSLPPRREVTHSVAQPIPMKQEA
jgi:hypothetical protein